MGKLKLFFLAIGLMLVLLAVGACTLSASQVGPTGPAGPPGPPGPAGPAADAQPPTVVVNITGAKTSNPGDTLTLKAAVDIQDGSTSPTYKWVQTAGAKGTIDNPTADTINVTLADLAADKAEILKNLQMVNRARVQPVSAGAIRAADRATFKVTVTTSSGSYSKTVNVTTNLPLVATTDLSNVAIGLPVLISGGEANSYSWTISGPAGSTAALTDANTRNPYFTPLVAGKYTLKETVSGSSVEIYAGKFTGALSGTNDKNQPESAACTGCHNGKTASNNFDTWKTTGHAGVFIYSITLYEDYAETCMGCHTVGYDTIGAANNGVNDQPDFAALKASGIIDTTHPVQENWPTVLKEYPKSASLTGIQCENCHGPNDTILHANGKLDAARINISSDVCAVCHARPSNHVQYQQWQQSGHGNFETAFAEGMNASCARCHAGQGFLAYLPLLEAGKSGSLPTEAMTWTAEEIQPITCATCHDPHDEGNMVGKPPEAKVRVEGDTAMLPSGFKAVAVGQGALCATCHNSRNGAHNNTALPVTDDRAPHSAAQADVLMGENAYFVTTGIRGGHANIENTCVTCHMQESPPPAPYTTAVNHSFKASLDMCGSCHGNFTNGENLKSAVEAKVHDLTGAIGTALKNEIVAQTKAGKPVTLVKMGANGADVVISDGSTVTSVALVESHGRQAMNITVSGTAYENVRLATDTKVGTGTLLTSPTGQIIAKAAWNLFLVEGDASGGVHNPSFTLEVLNSSIAALK